MDEPEFDLDTLLARSGHMADRATGAVAPPLHTSTTFARGDDYELPGDFVYGRNGSPTVGLAEEALRRLDGGQDAMAFGSGLGATTALLETLVAGDHIIAPTIMYHGAHDWMRRLAEHRGIRLSLFDAADDGALARAAENRRPTLVWIESPVNPTWDVIDIAEAAKITHAVGAILVVDSTVAPPITTRALDLGADIVLHSATKYLNGHSDVLGGVLITRKPDDRWEAIRGIRKLVGGIMNPFSAWLLLRGMKTLAVRFDRSSATALSIAHHFEGHPNLEAVLYPGLESHPRHDVACRQMRRGFGGMLSLLVRGDDAAARRVATRLRCFTPATSLGGVESLVEHRATVEGPHSRTPKNLLRFSIGLESPMDLITDLESAMREV